MDTYFKLIVLTFTLLFSSSSFAVWDLASRFSARNIAAMRKAELGSMLAGVAQVGYEATTSTGAKVYASRTINISKAAAGGLAKRLAFSPWGLGLSAALLAADYVLNDDGTVSKEIDYPAQDASSSLGGCSRGDGTHVTSSQCLAQTQGYDNRFGASYVHTMEWNAGINFYTIRRTTDAVGYHRGSWNPGTYIGESPQGSPAYTDTVTPTDSEIYDEIEPSLTDSTLKDLFTDVATGLPSSSVSGTSPAPDTSTSDTDPFSQEADNITNNYNTDLSSNPTTNPTEINNNSYSNESNVYTQPVEEQKSVCEKNPEILGCSKYGNELAATEIPNVELDFDFTPVIFASSASCPVPQVSTYSKGSFSVPTSYLCQFATGISPVVIAVSTVLGIMILTGGIRNG